MSPPKGFTKAQRRWLLRRDDECCALCGSSVSLHVHHIVPQRWARMVLQWPERDINAPTNGITLCAACHVGPSKDCIHPDIMQARRFYWYDKQAYSKVFGYRDVMCQNGVPYWNTAHDQLFATIAAQRTVFYACFGAEAYPW